MKPLQRKLWRDLLRTRVQVISIAAVLAGGVMTVVALRGTSSTLERARAEYYAAGRFADVFATLTRAPDALKARIEAIPGVSQVTTRVVKDVRLDVPGLDRPGVGRLISLPARRDEDAAPLNDVRVLRGAAVSPDAARDVLVSGRFANANHLGPGDSLTAVVNERRVRLRIVGIGAAPDYLYEEAGGGMMVDERAFGILWVPADLVRSATGLRGAFNDVAISIAPGTRPEQVITALDTLLAPYGSRGAIARKDQVSHRVVENELQQLAVMGLAFPVFFVAVAAFLAGTVLTRLVATEREQIAVLKAFGYSNTAVGLHYLAYAAAAIALGVLLGLGVGVWVGRLYSGVYAEILRIPGMRFRADWGAIALALGVLSVATLLGAARAVSAAANLPPAAALQSPAPAGYHALLLDRLGIGRRVPASVRMILRGLERRPTRAMLGAAGVASALAMMAGALSLYDASSRMIEVQFRIGHRESASVQLVSTARPGMRAELAKLPDVTGVELFRVVPVRLRHAGWSRTVALTGLEAGSQLHRLVDVRGHARPLPGDGVVVSASLARTLEARPGDTVIVDLLEQLETRRLVIAATIDELMSPNAYMDLEALGRLVGDGTRVSGAYVNVARGPTPEFYAGLREMPSVVGVSSRKVMLDNFDRMMARGFRITTTLVVCFASVIAIGVVYNGARIALSERGRELASLRVLGFTTREVGALLLGEQGILALLAVPLGWLLGWLFAGYLTHAFESEHFVVPLVTRSTTYALATFVVLLAASLAGALMYRRAAHLDLVAVLKTRE